MSHDIQTPGHLPTLHRNWRTWLLPVLAASALLQACSLLPAPSPVDVYQLPSTRPTTTPTVAVTDATVLPLSLRVSRPAAGALLAGQRLLVQPEADRISYYKGAQWSEPAPVLLRNRLLDALRADGRIATLSSDERILQADFELDGELRAFQSLHREDWPTVLLRIDIRLVRSSSQRIIASRRFEIVQTADSRALPEVVKAFGAASDRFALDATEWTISQLQSTMR